MPHKRNQGRYGRPKYDQASKIVARFGGETALAHLIGVSRISVYRWQYRRPYGCDGLIPAFQIAKIKSVARGEGILLRDEDWTPRVNRWEEDEPPAAPPLDVPTPGALADILA